MLFLIAFDNIFKINTILGMFYDEQVILILPYLLYICNISS